MSSSQLKYATAALLKSTSPPALPHGEIDQRLTLGRFGQMARR